MKKTPLLAPFLLAALPVTAAAQATIPVPAFSDTYIGLNSRGYWFKAPIKFQVTSMQVPDEGAHGKQNVAILNMGAITPTGTAGTANRLFLSTGLASSSPVSCAITIDAGDYIHFMGTCGDASNMYNSYSPVVTDYATNVLGSPITINRSKFQANMVTTGCLGWIEGEPTGKLGRVFVTVTPPPGLFPGFTADRTVGASPFTVNFSDQTYTSDPGGVTSWAWDFNGDSVIDSTVQNPSFTYPPATGPTQYSVTLTVTDATHGTRSLTKTNYITLDPPPVADFVATPTSGPAPLAVSFTDLSVAASTWAWDFNNDTIIDSTAQNPTFVFGEISSSRSK